MATSDLRKAYRDLLMERAFDCRYPSPTVLERVETEALDDESREAYVRALIDMMSEERYPSPMMMDRVAALLSRWE